VQAIEVHALSYMASISSLTKTLSLGCLKLMYSDSFSSSSPFDKNIKTMLICDVLTLVGIRGYDKKKVHLGPEDEKKQLSKIILIILIILI